MRFAVLLAAVASSGALASEVTPPESLPCFPGAYYRKAVSSQDRWSGIEGIVTLPRPVYDPDRRDEKTSRMLDNASIYMGGRAGGQEVDAGLTWEVIREADGSVSRERKAFRPFWRVTSWQSGPARPEYYYYPGDTVKMSIVAFAPGKLRMDIALLARAAEEPSNPASTATQFQMSDMEYIDPISTLSTEFDANGFGPAEVQEFKRVNAIDQVGNEGKGVSPTSSTIENAVWHEVNLIRENGKVPFTAERFTDMRCPAPVHFQVSPTHSNGGEVITIHGATLPASKTVAK